MPMAAAALAIGPQFGGRGHDAIVLFQSNNGFGRPRSGFWTGATLCGAIAAAAVCLGRIPWFASHGMTGLTVAILVGLALGNAVPALASRAEAGISFSKRWLLRLGIVLFGFRLTLQDVGAIGSAGVVVDAAMLASTFGLAVWLGSRWLGLDPRTTMLIGAGSAICGAAAVVATEPVVKARPEQVTVAIATVVVFGTLSMFLYPVLFILDPHGLVVPEGKRAFGLYIGSTVHEVAQVVAASGSIGDLAAGQAVIAKMLRVLMLAPFLVSLAAWLSHNDANGRPKGNSSPMVVPWFAICFLGVVLLNSVLAVPPVVSRWIELIGALALAAAMAALGLSSNVAAVRQAGIRPLVLALVLFVWLVVGGAFVNRGIVGLLGV